MSIKVSTPSRICIFGEHQDYLGLEVIAQAIDLRFYAEADEREDKILDIEIGSKRFNKPKEEPYQWINHRVDFSKNLVYENNRDYMKSIVNVLFKKGYALRKGYNIKMISEIPIGKGMCSSSTMIVALIKLLLECIDSEDKDNPEKIAYLGYLAEVEEFKEPGGMMDHYASALGNMVNLDFKDSSTKAYKIQNNLPGNFILFDSLKDKKTTEVLATAKIPVVEGLKKLNKYGIYSIKDFIKDKENLRYIDELEDIEKRNMLANIDNYKILQQGKEMLNSKNFSPQKFGALIKRHHENLRDGLQISTKEIEDILNTAYSYGALGGKINGSGGGGCCYVYAMDNNCNDILAAVEQLGYPGRIVKCAQGVRREEEL